MTATTGRGTGFVAGFATRDNDGHKLYATFLVTNKQVVDGGESFVAKVSRGDQSTLG